MTNTLKLVDWLQIVQTACLFGALIGLIVQLWLTGRATRASAYQNLVGQLQGLHARLSESNDAAVVLKEALAPEAEVTSQQMMLSLSILNLLEGAHFQRQMHVIPRRLWSGWEDQMAAYFRVPFFREVWLRNRRAYNDAFRQIMDAASARVDHESVTISSKDAETSQPEYVIRLCSRDDLAAVFKLELACFGRHDALPLLALVQYYELFSDTFLVAMADTLCVGFAIAGTSATAPQEAWLLDVAVAARQRGHGIAQALGASLLSTLRQKGVSIIRATVAPDNTPSRALCTRLGFVLEAYEHEYFGPRHPRLVLRRTDVTGS